MNECQQKFQCVPGACLDTLTFQKSQFGRLCLDKPALMLFFAIVNTQHNTKTIQNQADGTESAASATRKIGINQRHRSLSFCDWARRKRDEGTRKKNRQLNLAAPQEHIYQQVKIGCGPHELTFAPFCSENLLA